MKIYENYPAWIVLIVLLFQLAVYACGAYIMFTLSLIGGILYLAFIIVLEINILYEACTSCCYHGRICAFGRGVISKIFFKKGDSSKFAKREIKFKDILPQILVVLIPVIVGIAILINRGFNMAILIAIIYPVVSWFALNPLIYGKLACPHCKQGSIACPALDFFAKKKNQ